MNKNPGRPRRGAGVDYRAQILEHAAALFSECGYAATTLRRVAAAADCDVALISYYFDSKAGLFGEVMRLTVAPADVVATAVSGDRAGFVRRLASGIIAAWEAPLSGPGLRDLGRAALGHPDLRAGLSEYLDRELVTPLAEYLGGRHAREQASSILAVVAGTVFARYILDVPSVSAIPPRRAAAILAATLDTAITSASEPSRPRQR